ncbi:MAG: ribosome silencing factor [Gammaproteobacteria bacterium]|nr:ribosome silencing factor [Gammaproteobacteria bacterium]MBU6509165.1 ribosome silencing factor [Gammaproteobacteria bacterium]MDE1983165.1 ribosome silencing factor [Gammaproteobacteria bacterium]MDE2108121.1 ribosome silencing factor [Gammaproteobacteria bacterium]MDE2460651.1 ribosome silencing factor [Gammaproteobacteria bacterium]
MQAEKLRDLVVNALQDMKGVEVRVLDVRGMTTLMDFMVIASGTSDRHVKSLAREVQDDARRAGVKPMGVEGEQEGEWVLVDLRDVVVHVMRPQIRDFYNLEKLWSLVPGTDEAPPAQAVSRRP